MRVQKLLACSLWRSITFAPIFFEQAARKKRATWYRYNSNSKRPDFYLSHIQVQWSLLFYTLENYESELGDPELGQALVQLALATLVQQEVGMAQIELFLNRHFTCKVSKPLYTALLTGLERLVVAGIIRGRALDQVTLVSQFLQILENEQSK